MAQSTCSVMMQILGMDVPMDDCHTVNETTGLPTRNGTDYANGHALSESRVEPQDVEMVHIQDTTSQESASAANMSRSIEKSLRKVTIAGTPSRLVMLIPPVNFGTVEKCRIYRSAYPTPDNFPFIKSLGITTIL